MVPCTVLLTVGRISTMSSADGLVHAVYQLKIAGATKSHALSKLMVQFTAHANETMQRRFHGAFTQWTPTSFVRRLTQ
jgi:hypothetical protein